MVTPYDDSAAWKLKDMKDSNQVEFNDTYLNSDVTVTGIVDTVNAPTTYDGRQLYNGYVKLLGGWLIEVSDDVVDLVKTLKPGDTIEANGKLVEVFAGNLKVYGTSGYGTTYGTSIRAKGEEK